MSDASIRAVVVEVLGTIAPEVDPATIDPHHNLLDQLDIDSIDFLNLLMGVHERTGVDIPERDYGKVTTLDDLVAYLGAQHA